MIRKFEQSQELEQLIRRRYSHINGIVIIHQQQLLFESYYNGFQKEDAHKVASFTKSNISALIGLAIDQGKIKSIDQKVLDFFPEYRSNPAAIQKRQITLRQLLTMTVAYPYKQRHEPLDRLCRQKNWTTYILDSLKGDNGQGLFQYSSAGVHLLSVILTKATGQSAREFANEYLFRPLSMQEIPNYPMAGFCFDDLFGERVKGWVTDPQGHSTGGCDITLTPRDMARFGSLYLAEGQWKESFIISEKWIKDSTRNQGNDYGYLLWVQKDEEMVVI